MLSETPGENPSAGPTKQNQNPYYKHDKTSLYQDTRNKSE